MERVSPYDRVTVLQARHRMRCYYDAELYRDMASTVDAMGIEDFRWAAETASAEIQVALNLTRRALRPRRIHSAALVALILGPCVPFAR